ncbi:hypothetical protein [Oceanihabitans sediminis]|uniref:hypothetical protein n=1 Tax=Oceanihabitans sediminis TaxID=1812012 RepID=UPI00299EA079|nr:hypothetical protein [Oceanihabitans sediminis]MDX1773647.1 hypothetical protein [Oceanihabitans sediminis]
MKTLFITIFALVTFSNSLLQDKTTIQATFDGFESDAYYFIDDTDTIYTFDNISKEASKKFDLTDESNIGESFEITFTTETISDDMENEIEVLTIVELKKI